MILSGCIKLFRELYAVQLKLLYLNHINTSILRLTEINSENPRQLHPSPFLIVTQQLTLASDFVTDPLLYHISDFKKIVTGSFTIVPQMLERFPIWVLRIMDLATYIIAVTVIIPMDFDLPEFLLQEVDVTFEELLESRFYV
jgi:hypothetical protein